MVLKHKEIEALARDPRDRMVADGTPNLYVHVRASGKLNWVCRTTVSGKRVPFTIGPWPDVPATKARAATPVIVRLVDGGYSVQAIRNGIAATLDPDDLSAMVRGEKVSSDRSTPTFEEVARDWYDKHLKDGLSDGPYKRQVIQQLQDHVFPLLGRRPINELRRREIRDAIAALWVNQNPTAKKVRGNIERIFDFAIDAELRQDNPTPPPRSMPLHQHRVEHFSSLPHERIQEFWEWLNTRPRMGVHTHVGIALAVLLGKRTGEIRKMKWDQLDLARAIWVTPAENMKKRKAHRQPLPDQALAKLKLVSEVGRAASGYVFDSGSGKPLSENAMLYALKRFDDITTHGFRATLGSWCAENGVDKQVADYIKAHQPKYLDAAYQRSDLLEERRGVLQRWADYVSCPPSTS
ncbi:site-specific recombinase, phage integrase family protein [Rhodobacter sp. AKP1]|nr:site-specific recombinase, phage integrase family protein [Rhodobacter sp. AKP1]